MKSFSKSKKVLGLEILRDIGVSVPKFTYIPDFEVLGVDFCALNPNYQIPIIKEYLEAAILELGEVKHGVSIRSASFDEDDLNKSAAGRYISFNGLKNFNEIYQAAITIWKHHRSFSSSGVLCPIIIQETHCSYFSGVCFKDSSSDKPVIIIESYYGSCRTIVNGMVIPYRSTFINNTWTQEFSPEKQGCNRFFCHSGLFTNQQNSTIAGTLLYPKYEPFPKQVRKYIDSNQQEIEVYAYRPAGPPDWYADKICNTLINVTTQLDSGIGIDLEWGCNENGTMVFYQYRPLTKPLFYSAPTNITKSQPETGFGINKYTNFQGLPGAPGKSKGYISSNTNNIRPNTILMLTQATIEDVKAIEASVGIVSEMGGILSHLAIVCREFNKPCVVGIQSIIPDNTYVEIDGNLGIVNILESENH